MKSLFACIICLFGFTALCSDTIAPRSGEKFSFEERWERKKRRLDSALKETDAIMDSLTGKSENKIDTFALLKNYELKKKREAEERIYEWVKIGGLLLLGILGISAYVFRKKWMG